MVDVLKRPIITEKAMKLAEKRQYVFQVLPDANKIEIKKAVEEYFEVQVSSVRTANIKGKQKVRWTKKGLMRGRKPSVKKAYVTLKEGFSIELVSGVNSSEE